MLCRAGNNSGLLILSVGSTKSAFVSCLCSIDRLSQNLNVYSRLHYGALFSDVSDSANGALFSAASDSAGGAASSAASDSAGGAASSDVSDSADGALFSDVSDSAEIRLVSFLLASFFPDTSAMTDTAPLLSSDGSDSAVDDSSPSRDISPATSV